MFTGEVSLPLPLGGVSSRNGLSASISASYSSAGITEQYTTWNREKPTGVLGLGWTLSISKIVRDNKQTGTLEDDTYYLIEGGSSSKLVRIGGSSTARQYATENYQFWKITYYTSSKKWEITREDGTLYIYGGAEHAREYAVRWGNWAQKSILFMTIKTGMNITSLIFLN